ncbi:permease-like cell division protein FtsX [Paenibacillus sp. N1-5-1-14]|uniref:permease-like cell division protein FtsX n=1 Tax=Paenibacillus radicibacter TaxID=2972488 RepID=UPI002159B307|nr:permease-like cell division protein FtsX [Paenibacillus radicibacter]MCR8645003.1 permease-like cell division protein FtsX [Paenibacillus radicibacter]
MKIRTLLRHLREGLKSVIRNGWMTFASVASITISLFILGIFLILNLNVNYITSQIEDQVQIQVYLEVELQKNQVDQIGLSIQQMPGVKKVTYISKEQGLQDLKKKLGDVLEGIDENPLMDAYTVEVDDPKNVATIADSIIALNKDQAIKPIFKVNYGKGTVETLFKVTQSIRNAGLIIVGLLAFTAIFLIANTIKLTILAREREISIMKLVGATNWFIRWPFFVEGAILGFVGSIIPVGILLYGYWQLENSSMLKIKLLLIEFKPFAEISWTIAGLLIALGVLIGVWGSILSVRKSLKV